MATQTFEKQSNLLNTGNVFYTSLSVYEPRTPQYNYYRGVTSKVQKFNSYAKTRYKQIANTLYTISNNEAAKDIQFLQNQLKITISVDQLNDPLVMMKLIDTYNCLLQSKAAVDRHLKKLTSNSTQNTAYATIANYITNYFKASCNEIIRRKVNEYINNNAERIVVDYDASTLAAELRSYIVDIIQDIVQEATISAFNNVVKSKDLLYGDESRSYMEILEIIEASSNLPGNIFMDQFLEAMGFSSQNNAELAENLGIKINLNKLKKITTDSVKNVLNKRRNLVSIKTPNRHQKGTIAEYAAELFVREANKGHNFSAANTGYLEHKVDMIIATDDIIDEAVTILSDTSSVKGVGRDKSIQIMQNLSNRLNALADGFLIYTNIKDYKFGNWFAGFDTGEGGKLSTWKKYSLSLKDDNFINLMINCLQGAVFENNTNLQNQINKELAQDFAAFLFDDINVIGDLQRGSAKSLHLFYLDGIYVPLCYLLRLLADSFEEASISNSSPSVDDYIKVNVNYGTIKYYSLNEEQNAHGKPIPGIWTADMWEAQRQEAASQITLSGRFMNNFRDFLIKYKKYKGKL